MSETTVKTLAQMTAEVVQNNTSHGWYEDCATFPEAMALLHSEVSEALDAWRRWGLADATGPKVTYDGQPPPNERPSKPEGVPSEFADIFIRLLDDAWLFGQLDLDAEVAEHAGVYGVHESFATNMNVLHKLIVRMDESAGTRDYPQFFAGVLVCLSDLCEHYGIDLTAEYERKMAYNRTRPYRHGGKRL